MKPFDLELAKAGHPVCTRDGRPVRILCYDFITQENNPIIGLVRLSEKQEGTVYYRENGRFEAWGGGDHALDLMMAPEKKVGWINVYKSSSFYIPGAIIYDSREEALKNKDLSSSYVNTIEIEWEE